MKLERKTLGINSITVNWTIEKMELERKLKNFIKRKEVVSILGYR